MKLQSKTDQIKIEKVRAGMYKATFYNYLLKIDRYENKWYGTLSNHGEPEAYWEGKTKTEIVQCAHNYFGQKWFHN